MEQKRKTVSYWKSSLEKIHANSEFYGSTDFAYQLVIAAQINVIKSGAKISAGKDLYVIFCRVCEGKMSLVSS